MLTFSLQDLLEYQAAELMGKLHDRLKDIGYEGHPLEVYLVRILFCLFAEDTGIFQKDQFQDFILQKTNEDGSDLAPKIQELFQTLNTPNEQRFKNLDEHLNSFPYINGKLFEELLLTASFDSQMRNILLECSKLDWSKISPAIFGAMFQSVMNPIQRRNLGAHYTSEKNIMKVINPLFLDELKNEFNSIKNNKAKLIEFHNKLATLRFLDPACGCGNFLVITYRELRRLEIEVIKALNNQGETFLNIKHLIFLDVDQMYGIEIEEFPARIAEVALWLMVHLMNREVSSAFGLYFTRLPLKTGANIIHGNALRIDWNTLPKPRTIVKHFYGSENTEQCNIKEPLVEFSYILGNPPFVGKKEQSKEQKADMEITFSNYKGTGVLDYVSCWYIQSLRYIKGKETKVAFVSTNSITQGEQTGILWKILLNEYKINVHFAHRDFKWTNEARDNAAVYVIIIGFADYDISNKIIYDYETMDGEPYKIKVKNINPYLIDAPNITLENRKKPLCNVPEMNYGSMPIENGHLILSDEEKKELIKKEPNITDYLKPYIGGEEFINIRKRWCIWLVDAEPTIIKKSKFLMERIERTREFRSQSQREATQKLADTPMLFGEIRQPSTDYIIIPKVSGYRKYIPIGILPPSVITNGSALIIPNASFYFLGVLASIMHNIWTKYTCAYLSTSIQYSASVVYNNFPWPEAPTDKQKQAVEKLAQKVLDVRSEFVTRASSSQTEATKGLDQDGRVTTLADLYDPLTMPAKLAKVHSELDKAVDLCYRKAPFDSESRRMEFLFGLYEKYTKDLFSKEKIRKKKSANL